MMFPETQISVVSRLEFEYGFKAKSNNKLRGRCPSCNHKEASAWTNADEPWVIHCPRTNHCGKQNHIRDLFPDLFERWEKRFEPTPQDPLRTVNAYLVESRGFPIDKLKGLYSQESFTRYKPKKTTSVTLRFPITDEEGNHGWWQRVLDQQDVLPKTTFQEGWSSSGHSWLTPNTNYVDSKEIWITEGVFDTIALWLSDITSFSALSSGNYPSIFLRKIMEECHTEAKPLPKLIWAFDNDHSGHEGILRNIEIATNEGFECEAALPPGGRKKQDWNDLYKQSKLKFLDIEKYKYYGSLLIAEKAVDKGRLIYKRYGSKSFPFDFHNQTYWFKLDNDKYDDHLKNVERKIEDNEDWLEEEKEQELQKGRDTALKAASTAKRIMKCKLTALYKQNSYETDESWYYFSINMPFSNLQVKDTFTGGQLASSAEFKKRLISLAPAVYVGTGTQLDYLLEQWIDDIKNVELINYVGYHAEHKAYVLGDITVHGGRIFPINKDDYFELPGQINLKARPPFSVDINASLGEYNAAWIDDYITAFNTRGLIALSAFFGSLFAQQIRKMHKSFPFVEIVGEPGTGKTTLLQFLWKLMGRDTNNYEGVDPVKSTRSGLIRTFRQVSNMPVVLVESERENERGMIKQFDWDSIKTLYDGGSLGAQGVKNGGNDTYEPPFLGTIIISQNADVTASTPIMERIVHTKFSKEQLNKTGLHASRRLSKYEIKEVSQFALNSTQKEQQILTTYQEKYDLYEEMLHEEKFSIKNYRVIQNHAQLKALFDALCQHIIKVPLENQKQFHDELNRMAQKRDQVVKSDSIIVQNFWTTYEEMESEINLPPNVETNLNHSPKPNLIAINFAHLYKLAADYRYSLPDQNELQTALRHSLNYRFVEANKVVQSRITKGTKRCWIFEKPVSKRD